MPKPFRYLKFLFYPAALLLIARIIHSLIQFSFGQNTVLSYFYLLLLAYALIVPVYMAKNLGEIERVIRDSDKEFLEGVIDFTEKVVPFWKRSLPLLIVIKLSQIFPNLAGLIPAQRLVDALIGLNYAAFISIILFTETEISDRKKEKISKLREFLE